MTDDELRGLFAANAADKRQAIDAFGQRMGSVFSSLDSRLSIEIRMDSFATRMEARIAQSEAETRHQFGLLREAMKRNLAVLSEVALSRDEFLRAYSDLSETVRRTAAETQALLRSLGRSSTAA